MFLQCKAVCVFWDQDTREDIPLYNWGVPRSFFLGGVSFFCRDFWGLMHPFYIQRFLYFVLWRKLARALYFIESGLTCKKWSVAELGEQRGFILWRKDVSYLSTFRL